MGIIKGRIGGSVRGYDLNANVTESRIIGRIGGAIFGSDIDLEYSMEEGYIKGLIGGVFIGRDVSREISRNHVSMRIGRVVMVIPWSCMFGIKP